MAEGSEYRIVDQKLYVDTNIPRRRNVASSVIRKLGNDFNFESYQNGGGTHVKAYERENGIGLRVNEWIDLFGMKSVFVNLNIYSEVDEDVLKKIKGVCENHGLYDFEIASEIGNYLKRRKNRMRRKMIVCGKRFKRRLNVLFD
ncbi:hypothetical protein CMI42_05445 [Candidatus Pacearchaeota archaeon]|nr:hypothetical protein [Candidatus Pacearchaeota archaeon]|tara:strand:- start:1410 stop:1841 length:432 start_codon:yes stop_codon:yes gene_type:complete